MPPKKALRIAAVVVMIALLAIAARLGLLRKFADPASGAETLLRLGVWGYAAFLVAYAVLQPFGVPGTAFIVAAPLIWPWPIAFALSMVGTMAASVVGFSFARLVARDWFAARMPARFKRYDESLAEHAFATVFVLRLVFWMPPLLHAFFGVARVRFWTHFWGSFSGYLLPVFLVSFFGERLFVAARGLSIEVWIALAVGTAVVAAIAWIARRWWSRIYSAHSASAAASSAPPE